MVHFVGAGPGAPDLITRRGAALLQTADCIIYAGSLVNPALLGLVLRFPVVFAANYFGQNVVESFLKLMPHWLTHSFEIMGGILPALGFAITIMVIGKKSLLPWFIGGFFAVLYLKVDIMAMAIFGTCVAFLIKGLAKNEGAA